MDLLAIERETNRPERKKNISTEKVPPSRMEKGRV
jgi:hypothetical protein